MKRGDLHTKLCDVLKAEIIRQHPDTVSVEDEFDLTIHQGEEFVPLDVSSLAEVVLDEVDPLC